MDMHTHHLKNKPGETLFGFLMVALSLFLFWQSYRISGFDALSSPGTFPMAASGLMVITSCIACVQNLKLRTAKDARFFETILPPIVAIMIAMILIFAVLLDTLGFVITAFLFLTVSIKFLHRASTLRTLLLSAGILLLIYVVFRLLFKVILPEGILPEREFLAWVSNLFNGQ